MAIDCRHCGAQNAGPGQCVLCLKNLGDPKRALVAAAVSTVTLSAVWIGIAWIANFEFSLFATLYGVTISAAVLVYAKGKGPLYQAIASTFTVVGLVVADTIVVWLVWDEYASAQHIPRTTVALWELMKYQLTWDPWVWLWLIAGLMGGFYIWNYDSSAT